MVSKYIFSKGMINRDENTLYFKTNEQKIPLPIEQIEEIYLMNNVSISSQAIHLISKKEVILHFFDHYGNYDGSFFPKSTLISGRIIVLQAKHYLEENKRMFLAKQFIKGAMKNIGINIRTLLNNRIDIKKFINNIENSSNIEEIMSFEGNLRKKYYEFMDEKTNKFGFVINKRSRRPPKTNSNALLSFLNSLLYAKIIKEIYYTHVNPMISFLHEPSERRYSLALDISEIFKPFIVERYYLSLICNRIIQPNNFIKNTNGLLIEENSRKKIVKFFEENLKRTIKHKTLKRKISYERLIRLEIYKLEKHFLDMKKYKPLIAWW